MFFVWGNIYAQDSDEIVEEIVVRAESSIASRLGEAGSASIISKDEIEEIGATHANEVLARVPGVWVNRGVRPGTSNSDSVCCLYGIWSVW